MPLLPTIAINKARSCASCTFKIRCFLYIQYHVIARDCTFIKHQVRSGAGASYTGTYNTRWYQVFYVHNALGVREQVLHVHTSGEVRRFIYTMHQVRTEHVLHAHTPDVSSTYSSRWDHALQIQHRARSGASYTPTGEIRRYIYNTMRSSASCTYRTRCFMNTMHQVLHIYNTRWEQKLHAHNAPGKNRSFIYTRSYQVLHVHTIPGENRCFMHRHQALQIQHKVKTDTSYPSPDEIMPRVFNKIVFNRLIWNLKRLHDKMGGG